MSKEEILWHYNEFVEIQILVDKKLSKNNLDLNNEEHAEQIVKIIKDTVLEFKNWL
jgi:hypothetical protein